MLCHPQNATKCCWFHSISNSIFMSQTCSVSISEVYLCLRFGMLLDIAYMCIYTKAILASGGALYMASIVDQLSFNLVFKFVLIVQSCVTMFCDKVSYFYLCSYGTSGWNIVTSRNFPLGKFPRGIQELLGFWENKEPTLWNGSRQIVLL